MMYWQQKIVWTELSIAFTMYRMNKNRDIDNPAVRAIADVVVMSGGTVAVAAIWYPELRVVLAGAAATTLSVPATAVTVPIAIGGIASVLIGGGEGLRNYEDFFTGEVSPEEWRGVVVPAV